MWLLLVFCALFVSIESHENAQFFIQPKQLKPEGKMPVVGYGTYLAKDDELEGALEKALEAGYRHIDTATFYQNEHVIGKVLNKWFASGKLKREEMFITTKLPPFGNRPEGVKKYLDNSLKNLQLDYVDLYLIHTPFGFDDIENLEGNIYDLPQDNTTDVIAIWKCMEEQVYAGKAKAIGLSNFNTSQIQRVLDASRIKPANVQVELQVYNQQVPLVEFCKKNDISVTAYSPLGAPGSGRVVKDPKTGENLPKLLDNPVVKEVAKKNSRTEAQILLRHAIQKGLIVIPKSTNPERLKQNLDVFGFELDGDDMEKLNDLDLGDQGRFLDFKGFKGIDAHPEYPF